MEGICLLHCCNNLKKGVIILDLKIMELCHIGSFWGETQSFYIWVSFIFESSVLFFFSAKHRANPTFLEGRSLGGRQRCNDGRTARRNAALAKAVNHSRAFSSEDLDPCARVTVQLLRLLQDKLRSLPHLLQVRGANADDS